MTDTTAAASAKYTKTTRAAVGLLAKRGGAVALSATLALAMIPTSALGITRAEEKEVAAAEQAFTDTQMKLFQHIGADDYRLIEDANGVSLANANRLGLQSDGGTGAESDGGDGSGTGAGNEGNAGDGSGDGAGSGTGGTTDPADPGTNPDPGTGTIDPATPPAETGDGSQDATTPETQPASKPAKKTKPTAAQLIQIIGKAPNAKKLSMVNTTKTIPAKQKKALQKAIKNITKSRKMGFIAINLDTGEGFCYNANANIHSASTLKGPYLAAISKYQTKKASQSRYRGLYSSLIHQSSNDAFDSLRSSFGSSGWRKMIKASKASGVNPSYGYQHVRVKSLAKLWVSTWDYISSNKAQAKRIRKLYTSTIGSEVYLALKGKKGYTTYSKGGWYPGPPNGHYTSYNTAGVVIRPDGTRYLVAVMTKLDCYNSQVKKSRALVRSIDKAMGALARKK